MARLGILGLYKYDPTIFDDMIIPTADDITDEAEKIENPFVPDKGDLIANILLECAELELLYPDADTMRHALEFWSRVHIEEWRGLYNTLLYRYNPIWNKDGTIVEEFKNEGSDTRTPQLTTKNTRTPNLNTKETRTPDLSTVDDYSVTNMKTDHTGNVTKNVTGYDTNTLLPSEQSVQDTHDTTNGANKNVKKETGTDTIERKETGTDINEQTETGTDTHVTTDGGRMTRRETGNIGVTMTQEMIERQREVVRFNLYEYITKAFKRQFCLLIY